MGEDTKRLWVDSMPDAYERLLVPAVFGPFATDLAARVARQSPNKVLELAAGTGVLTREILAAAPSAEVTATDLNEAMVEYGRTAVPGAAWQPADAMALPFDDATFDVVACQFGVMFLPDRVAGFAEALRVLKPGGRLLVSVWDTIESHEFEAAVVAELQVLFPDDPPMFLVETPHGCHDAAGVVAELLAGGFGAVLAETVTVRGRARSAESLAEGYCTGTPLRAAIEARGDLTATIEQLTSQLQTRLGAGPVTGSMSAHVFEAQRPE